MPMSESHAYKPILRRMAEALERLAPKPPESADLDAHEGYIWDAPTKRIIAIDQISRLPLKSLHGIESQKQIFLENSRAFAKGLQANNALLWGARGTGKSSLVKAVHGTLNEEGHKVGLVEIQREDLADMPALMRILVGHNRRFIVFCDDLTFGQDDASYKSLKAVLEGGLAGRPKNILLYATSNRRHLMPRDMRENELGSAINPSETAEEKISLSDRFGLWIGFYAIDQETFLAMIKWYLDYFQIPVAFEEIRGEALAWALARGSRSGRTAFQYITHLAIQYEIKI